MKPATPRTGPEWHESRTIDHEFEGQIDVVKDCADLPAASVLSSIMHAADSFAAGAKHFDDMTLVVLRVLA